jgi:cellulose synthase/poly-beta-1,6-N-acetylglucosamine synthase-like glycosyltransferase
MNQSIDTNDLLILLSLLGSYFLIISVMQFLLQALSYRRYQKYTNRKSQALPSLTLLIPVRNESEVVVEALNRTLQLPLENFEVIVVENASTDRTYHLLHEIFQLRPNGTPDTFYSILHPRLRVIKSTIPGKARALNSALGQVKTEIVATLDADTIPESDGLIRLLNEFHNRPKLKALGGIVRVMDPSEPDAPKVKAPKSVLYAFQRLEYLRAFSSERLGWGQLKAYIYMSGALALFRTENLKSLGGFQTDSVTEDLETTLALIAGNKDESHPIDILPIVVAWTQVPFNLTSLFNQRRRWQAGLWQCLWKYKSLFFNSSKGLSTTLTMPYVFLTEALAPLAELFAVATVMHALFYQMIDPMPVIVIAIIGLCASGALICWAAVAENRFLKNHTRWSILKVFVISFPMNLIYRPIITLVRIEATLRFPWFKTWKSIKRDEVVINHQQV